MMSRKPADTSCPRQFHRALDGSAIDDEGARTVRCDSSCSATLACPARVDSRSRGRAPASRNSSSGRRRRSQVAARLAQSGGAPYATARPRLNAAQENGQHWRCERSTRRTSDGLLFPRRPRSDPGVRPARPGTARCHWERGPRRTPTGWVSFNGDRLAAKDESWWQRGGGGAKTRSLTGT